MTIQPKKFELRRISYTASLSEETSAYSAQLWVDGKHICDVSNHGQGGCDEQHPPRGIARNDAGFQEQLAALEAYAKALPARDTGMVLDGKPFIMGQSLESICGDLLSEHLLARDLQRLLKRTIAYFDPGTKAIKFYKGKHEGVERAHLVSLTLRKNPQAQVLNNLPFDQALAIYKADAQRQGA